jgi:hypothetical protein
VVCVWPAEQEARNTSLYAQFREHPETCRFILKAEPLRDAIQGVHPLSRPDQIRSAFLSMQFILATSSTRVSVWSSSLSCAVLCCAVLTLDPADMCDVLGGGDVTFHATRDPEEIFRVSD